MSSPSLRHRDSSSQGAGISGQILRVPVPLLRFHQPMAEHGSGCCPQPIGEACPPGHVRFRSCSE
jgi:hypothetical protein